ncbi:uncharacterized protein LOC134440668 [Engraulis encrasicolus]|uniref:uncharacterized protein LOC134440668 n=1 Tax=Engraulis encrasicolus TaxID=184585 RepID=UPI002FD022A6
MLDETTRVEDEENWYKPKLADIAAFIDKVFEWIKSVENSSSPSATEVTSSANIVQVHEADPLIIDGAQAELDLFDVQSHRSNASSRRSHTSTRSLRINAEAEREALLTEASKLQQKHAIEEQELLLRKQREALELSVKLDASNAKINYLKAAENNSLGPIPFDLDATHMSALGGGASQAEQLDEELESPISFLDTPSVKPKVNAAHVNVPLLNPDHNMATLPNRPTSSEQVQCTALPSLPHGADINISSLQIQPAVSSAQEALPTQPPSQPPTSLSIESQAMPLQPLWLKPRPLLQPQLQAPLLSQPLQPQLPAPLQPQSQPPPHTQAPLQLQQQSQPPPSPLPQPPLQPQQPVPQFQPPPLQPQRRPQQQSQRQLHPQLQPSQPPWPQLQPPLLPQQLQSQLRTQQPQSQLQFRPPQALLPQPPPQAQPQLQTWLQLQPQPPPQIQAQLQPLSQLQPQPQPTPRPQLQLQPPLAPQPQSQLQPQPQTPSTGTPSSPHDRHMIKVLENQNELTRLLMKQQLSSTLPQGNIPVFDGEVLEYKSFIHSFQNMIERKTDNNRDRLQFLIQYTKGQAQKLVKSCEYMAPDKGYQKALKLLKENFGNEYKICCAYLERALSWPHVKSEDAKSLQEYAMFIRSCCNAMDEMCYMEELDTVSTMKGIVGKLPFKLKERWRSKAFDLQQQRKSRVRILDLVSFMEDQARIAGDPMFGDLLDQPTTGKSKAPTKSQPSSSSYFTSVTLPPKVPKSNTSCHFCSSKHALDRCKKFKEKAQRDKLNFLKARGICFGCLTPGHISKDCSRRLTCSMCKQSHPSTLHIEPKDNGQKRKMEISSVSGSAAELCCHMGAGDNECTLSIIPVNVRAAKGSQVFQTYALLDPGSSATFCSEELMTRLHARGKRTNIRLRTMNQVTSFPTHVLSELEVSALDSDNFFHLPDTFTQKEMPVTTSSIPKQTDLAHWAHLSKVTIPSISSKVELLIGTNAPHLLEPWEVVNSQNGGPWACRTVLGWVIFGSLRSAAGGEGTVTVNRISVKHLEKLVASEDTPPEEMEKLSIGDTAFLTKANKAALENGLSSSTLPPRKMNVPRSSHRKTGDHTHSVKRKMKMGNFKQEHNACLSNNIEETSQVKPMQPPEKTHNVMSPKAKESKPPLHHGQATLPVGRTLESQRGEDFRSKIQASPKSHNCTSILSVVIFVFALCFLGLLISPVKQLLQEPTTSSSPHADARVSGYGCVSNIRQVNKQNVVHVKSELEMSRIHPPQNIAVPGLELAATALLEKEDRMLRRGLPLDMESSVFWKKEEPIISKHHPCEVEPEGRRWSEPELVDSASQEKDKADAESRCSTMIQATKRKDEDHMRCKKPGPG